MFSDPNLDAPPPRSQFRRPWSPEPYDPRPSTSNNTFGRFQNVEYDVYDPEAPLHGVSLYRHQQRREASDVSVEALDLADYARTLRIRQTEDPYPAFPSEIIQNNNRPPSSFPVFPTPVPPNSRETMTTSPPSLVSRGPTLSSLTTHRTSSSARHPTRRPFSLPVVPVSNSHPSSSRSHLHPSPYIVDPDTHANPSDEIDISRFPKWSRTWYNSNNPSARLPQFPEPDADIYTPLPPSQFQSARAKKSPFDPGYVHDPYNSYNPYDLHANPQSSVGHDSRDVLPWSNDPPDYGPPVDPMTKEERMRMLEREFGGQGKEKDKYEGNGLVDAEGKPLVGTVDERGRLVTTGPRRRVAFRIIQVLLAVGACIPAIYAAVAIKTDSKTTPPPAGKPPTFVLYILSSITLLVLLYMYVVRPCCCIRSKSHSKHPHGLAANMGMMVLPVGAGGHKNKKKEKRKKGGKYGPPGAQDVQVNLIVDPTAFQPPDPSDSESEEDEYGSQDGSMPGGFSAGYETREQRARRKKRNRNRRRKGVFEGLAMEEEWITARAWAKKVTMVDVAGLVLWGAAFVFILTGKRCPTGGFNGWCNAYNASTASACLLCVAFGVTTFFDVQDLHASKQSPRTRS